ncbi:MazG-like family protein [Actinoplanes rectilineatus]|uniref:MazG-like family protein n=1 Tax=Actinoplanes rectilineatus TaxID=113571 RepID=UPI000AE176D0|nr:MazG-like family protein [Actinoplanes rectilineatus]
MTSTPNGKHPRDPANGTRADAEIWETIDRARRWLDDANGTDRAEMSMRIVKIAEEYGEVAAAWVGSTGQNPRKGITHTQQDVVAELGDVAFTALVAAASLGADPRKVLADVAAKVASRLDPAEADTVQGP